ncbi:MAG: hypothetical protein M3023_07825, partial [Pseudomonadota bacterium]|nr:hypothetical protein [Pseudomonadota bacterium]
MAISLLAMLAVGLVHPAQAQQAKLYRVGVIHEGGPYRAEVDGLRDELKALGLEDGKHILLEIRDVKGDVKAAEEAARSLEREKVALIFVAGTSVAIRVKGATTAVPIVFGAGSDPVAAAAA